MSQLLQPRSFDPKDLNSVTARWEEKVRMLPDDIFTEMTEGPLKEHLVLSTTKLREETQCYLENRQNSEPVAMDIHAFVKEKRSEGTGPRSADVCTHCGKNGHWLRQRT